MGWDVDKEVAGEVSYSQIFYTIGYRDLHKTIAVNTSRQTGEPDQLIFVGLE